MVVVVLYLDHLNIDPELTPVPDPDVNLRSSNFLFIYFLLDYKNMQCSR